MSRSLKSNFTPPIILVIICLIVTLALSLTYKITKPIIDRNISLAESEAMALVLPGSDSFKETSSELAPNVEKAMVSTNGAGIAVLASEKSFGGPLKVMVGISSDGKITGVTIVSHADTPGLGTLPMEEDVMSQYVGLSSLPESTIKNDAQVDAISGATISSNAIYLAIKNALGQYALGGNK